VSVIVSGATGGPVHARPEHHRRMLVCECVSVSASVATGGQVPARPEHIRTSACGWLGG